VQRAYDGIRTGAAGIGIGLAGQHLVYELLHRLGPRRVHLRRRHVYQRQRPSAYPRPPQAVTCRPPRPNHVIVVPREFTHAFPTSRGPRVKRVRARRVGGSFHSLVRYDGAQHAETWPVRESGAERLEAFLSRVCAHDVV
jgi:hypothetical protein